MGAFQSNVGLGYRWRAQRNEQETNDQAHVPLHLCLFVPRFHRGSYSRASSPRDRVGFRISFGNHPRIWVALCESFRDRNPLQPQDAAALQRTECSYTGRIDCRARRILAVPSKRRDGERTIRYARCGFREHPHPTRAAVSCPWSHQRSFCKGPVHFGPHGDSGQIDGRTRFQTETERNQTTKTADQCNRAQGSSRAGVGPYGVRAHERKAKRKKIEAEGISSFQRIVSEGISTQLLQWKGIEATEKLAASDNAKLVVMGNTKDSLPVLLASASEDDARSANRMSHQSATDPKAAADASTPITFP